MKTLRTQTTQHTDPVGVCIYCGSNESLSDEHVIPLSLGGNYILDKASCSTCAGVTSAFEGRLTRGFMRDARVVGRYPTRRPKERPKSLPLKVRGADTAEVFDLAPAEHPGFLHLPVLAPAGRLHGRDHARGVTVSGSETIVFGKDPLAVAKDLNASQMESTVNWDVTSLARLLAKVAYASAVASVGLLPREHVPVLPVILGTADDASHWLGSADCSLHIEAEGPTHAIGLFWEPDPRGNADRLLVARIKLFARSGATGYEVVVYEAPKAAT